MTSGTSAIGGGSQSSSTKPQMNYNTPAATIGNQISDGDQFLVLKKSRQSDEFTVWSSGDDVQTLDLFTQARRQVDQLTHA